MNTSRRTFMITFVATGTALAATSTLAQAELDEKDPQAARGRQQAFLIAGK